MISPEFFAELVDRYIAAGCPADGAESLVRTAVEAQLLIEEQRATIVEAASEGLDASVAASLGILVLQLEVMWLQWCLREAVGVAEATIQ